MKTKALSIYLTLLLMILSHLSWAGNTITYTSSDGRVVYPRDDAFSANIISNVYQNGKGIISLDGEVTSIGDQAFSGCRYLTSIEIPESVTSIGKRAFSGCYSLTSIKIPSSVTDIADYAFNLCVSLISIDIPSNVAIIGDRSFEGCFSLTSIEIPSSVTSIGYAAFQECLSLTSIEIPVTSIGDDAFWGCRSLTSIVLPSSVTSIGDRAFAECSSLASIEIPANVTSIGKLVIEGCSSLTSVVVNSENRTFDSRENCNAIIETATNTLIIGSNSAIIPSSVTSIGDRAFECCPSLTSIVIPSSVTSIGDGAFEYCPSLTSIVIPSSVTSIGNDAFYLCYFSKNSFVNKSSVTNLWNWGATIVDQITEEGLVIDKNVVIGHRGHPISVTIPSNVTSIGDGAFYNCSSLTSIEVPSSVTSIGSYAFSGCSSLTSIVLPSSVTGIGYNAFQNCSYLTSIEIPEGVTSIGDDAFLGCSSLTSIEIPSSVTRIGNWPFEFCYFSKDNFKNNSKLTDKDNWGARLVDSETSDHLLIKDDELVFCRPTAVSAIIPNNVKRIKSAAFSYCPNLTNISIPNNGIFLEDGALCGCVRLESITFPENVSYIGHDVLEQGNNVKNIFVGKNPINIAENAFIVSRYSDFYYFYLGTLYVPVGCKSLYQSTAYWNEFQNIQEYIDSEDLSNVNNTLYAGHLEKNSDSQCLLPICMKNDKIFTGFQCDVIIPNGFSFVFDEYGFAEADLVEDRISKKAMTFETEIQSDGSLRLLAYSSKNIAFAGNDGEVAAVTLHISSDLGDGDYPILLKNIVLTEATGVTTKIDNVKSTITVFSYTLGDANGDREINVGDLAATASYILGNPPANFVFKGADANEDNEINVGDLAKIAGIILGTSSSKAPKRGAETETSFDMNMMLEPMSDNSYLLHVGVDNMGVSFSGFQFDLNLPDGLSVKTDADGFAEVMLSTDRTNSRKADLFDSRFMEDGQLRVLCASSHNALFEGESGEVATILLEADGSFDAQGTIALRNIVYTATGEGEKASDVELNIANGNSSIEMVNSTTFVSVYDMNGRIVKYGVDVEKDLETLPRGVYVINGKKIVL